MTAQEPAPIAARGHRQRRRPRIARHRGRPPTAADLAHLATARSLLRDALRHLDAAGAHHAGRALRRAQKSLDGAARHAALVLSRTRPILGASETTPPLSPHGDGTTDWRSP